MSKVLEVNQNDLIESLAKELSKDTVIQAPEWASFVKTGAHKQRPPMRDDWWHMRSAAVLRKIYFLGPIGVSKLRRKYGGKKNMGVKPERVYKGSGNIIRKAIQQLNKAGYVKFMEKGVYKGQILTPKGISLIEKTAKKL